MSENNPVVGREPCPSCGSRDNLARYAKGDAYCFTPGCGHYEPPTDGTAREPPPRDTSGIDWLKGEYRALGRRGLTEETCRKFDYAVADTGNGPVQVATYWRDGLRVAQKVRTPDKRFWAVGDMRSTDLYGQHLWPATGRRVVVTEGEIDALSVAQAFGLTWPVVSVPNGAGSAEAAFRKALPWLEGYTEVVIWFDNDDVGRQAAEKVARLLKPGRAKLAFAPAPYKDASDMLMAGDVRGLCRVVYDATTWRPEGIVTVADVRERVLVPTAKGDPWPWPGLTEATFGRREGEVYALGAGTGVGKTDFLTQTIAHDVVTLGRTCGVLYLEQLPVETVRRIAGKLVSKRLHVPDGSWTEDELRDAVAQLEATNRLHLFDAFGATSWDVVGATIRYMAAGLGCEHIFLDHLTALAAAEEDERKALERIMAELAGLAQEHRIKLHFVSHLATPEGKPHEEGGRVMIRHFKGSRAIGFWSHFMFGLERNQQADDPEERAVTTLRCLKDRFTGNANGLTWTMRYDPATGLLNEVNTFEPARPRPQGNF